jgi:malate dehydrogenase (quinone)
MSDQQGPVSQPDVVLVGAGIMSMTLAVLLMELEPEIKIELYEVLDKEAQESSDPWNNAGTGHAALCELNYTPQQVDGSIDISKALDVNTRFDLSRQMWAFLVKQGAIKNPQSFIHAVPHCSFVWGDDNVAFLRKRYEALVSHHTYQGMEFTTDRQQLADWFPLVMEGRDGGTVAATRMSTGTDVNYGALTSDLLSWLRTKEGFTIHFNSLVEGLKRDGNGWDIHIKDQTVGEKRTVHANFVFLGAGGGALPLLQKSEIPEQKNYAGFPVSGFWLRCDNEALAARHDAKVYGKAGSGSPPMSVPHLDRRHVDGKVALLFGPYAGWSTKFLKHGSYTDLFKSVEVANIIPMLDVAKDNLPLEKYLIGQVLETSAERFAALREYYPGAHEEDWRLEQAGQRVQIIKHTDQRKGALEFGTEIVTSSDGTIAALLGASPGASTSVSIMLNVLQRCFGQQLTDSWMTKLKLMIPSYGISLVDDAALCDRVRAGTAEVLNIHHSENKTGTTRNPSASPASTKH